MNLQCPEPTKTIIDKLKKMKWPILSQAHKLLEDMPELLREVTPNFRSELAKQAAWASVMFPMLMDLHGEPLMLVMAYRGLSERHLGNIFEEVCVNLLGRPSFSSVQVAGGNRYVLADDNVEPAEPFFAPGQVARCIAEDLQHEFAYHDGSEDSDLSDLFMLPVADTTPAFHEVEDL